MKSNKTTTRNTLQRALVLDAVRAMHDHPTSAEIYERVKTVNPKISQATVYRNLHMLADRGEILRVKIPGAADRYDFNLDPHHHLVCTQCGRIDDVELRSMPDFTDEIVDAHEYCVTGLTVVFEGLCPACRQGISGKAV